MRFIIDRFEEDMAVLENENKVHGNITIVVLPDDYEKIKIF